VARTRERKLEQPSRVAGMGLLDWFRRLGASEPGSPDATAGGREARPDERAHGAGVPPGSASEGPPVGVSDPGSLTGDDAGEVVGPEQDDESAP
jgi:hypothetical protein